MKLSKDLSRLEFLQTAHLAGKKKILFSDAEADSALTQLAFGFLPAGETVEEHAHATMEEFFYFLEGSGEYRVAGEVMPVHEGIAVRIPAAAAHELHAVQDLHFIYFGIALK